MYFKLIISIFISLLAVGRGVQYQARWAADRDYYAGLTARSYDDSEDDFLDLYSRDAEPEAYDDSEDDWSSTLAARAGCKRGDVLTKRGNCFSTPLRDPSHCHEVLIANHPGVYPPQIPMPCRSVVKCKGAEKIYKGVQAHLEKAQCLAACTCP